MRTVTLAYAREELLRRRTKGAKGGETKRDEVKAMGPASVSMLLTLTLLNRGKSRGMLLSMLLIVSRNSASTQNVTHS